jgi:hypothetical protein
MRWVWVLAAVAAVAAAAPARADDAGEPPATFHKGQLGISARFGLGVRGIATYNSDYCGKSDPTAKNGNAPVCTGRAPLAFDLEGAFGVAKHVELLVELRIGIERDFAPTSAGGEGPRPLFFAPGARFFFSEAEHLKLFIQPELVFDVASYKDAMGASRGNDIGVRGLQGLWIDLHRTYGIYFYVGETAEFARWLSGEMEGGFGIQGRYP